MSLAGVTLVELAELPAGAQLTGRVRKPQFAGDEPMDFLDTYQLGEGKDKRRFEVYEFASGRRLVYERVVDGAGGDEPRGAA